MSACSHAGPDGNSFAAAVCRHLEAISGTDLLVSVAFFVATIALIRYVIVAYIKDFGDERPVRNVIKFFAEFIVARDGDVARGSVFGEMRDHVVRSLQRDDGHGGALPPPSAEFRPRPDKPDTETGAS